MSTPSNEMWGTARLVIREGKLEDLKRLVARAMEIVRTKEPGTIEYSVFINAEGTECFVHERFRDPAAGLEHSRNMSPLMQEFMEACTITGEVCGNPSPELRKSLEAGGVKVYAPLQSVSRS
jgi:quinol monooxygenase YgiN